MQEDGDGIVTIISKLEPWQELVAALKSIDIDENSVCMNYTCCSVEHTEYFPLHSAEGEALVDVLGNLGEGTRFGAMRTDVEKRPFAVRVIDEQNSTESDYLQHIRSEYWS